MGVKLLEHYGILTMIMLYLQSTVIKSHNLWSNSTCLRKFYSFVVGKYKPASKTIKIKGLVTREGSKSKATQSINKNSNCRKVAILSESIPLSPNFLFLEHNFKVNKKNI